MWKQIFVIDRVLVASLLMAGLSCSGLLRSGLQAQPAAKPETSSVKTTAKPALKQKGGSLSTNALTTGSSPTPLTKEAAAVATDWPQILGPNHVPISSETNLLHDWGGPSNKLTTVWTWETGESFTAPIIADGRAYIFHRVDDEERLDCLDALTGNPIWQFNAPTTYRDRYGFNGGPRAAPVVANAIVFIHGAEGRFHALDAKTGTLKWTRDLSTEYKVTPNFFGVGACPIAYEKEIIVNVGGDDGTGILAMDQAIGSNVWSVQNDWGPSYATPVIQTLRGKAKLLVFAGGDTDPPLGGLISVDLETRRKEFEFPFRCSRYESVNATSPVVWKDDVFVSFSIRDKGAMIRSKDGGYETRWETESLGAYWMTPIVEGDYIYGIGGEKTKDARIVCLEAETGKEAWRDMPMWTERFESNGDMREMKMSVGRGSLLKVDGSWLCLGEYGHLLWLDLSPAGCTVLQRTWLFEAQSSWSMPVVSKGLLYVSQHERGMLNQEPTRVHCFDLRTVKR